MSKVITGTVIIRPIPLNRKPKQVLYEGKLYKEVKRDLDGYYIGSVRGSVIWDSKVNPEDLYELSVAIPQMNSVVQILIKPDQWQEIKNKNLVGTQVEFIVDQTEAGDLEARLTSNNFQEYEYVFTREQLTNLLITTLQQPDSVLSSRDYTFIKEAIDNSPNKRMKS